MASISAPPALVYRTSPDYVLRKLVDQFLLVSFRKDPTTQETIYILNEVGAFLWETFDGKRTLPEVLARVEEEFDADAETIRREVEPFLAMLCEARLLLPVPA